MKHIINMSWEWDRIEELRRDKREEEHQNCGFRWDMGAPEESTKYFNEHCAHCSYMQEMCMYGEQ